MSDPDEPQLDHSPFCRRKSPPIIRLSWGMQPEWFCPECGRYGPAPDQRTERKPQ